MLPCYPGFSASARPLPSCHTIAKQFYPFFKTSFDWLELFKNEITPYQIIIPIFFASCQTRLLILEIVVLDTFSPNCPTGSLIDVYTIYVLSFLANCHGWKPVSGSPFLQIDVPDTFVMELHLSEGTLFWKLRNHITLRRPWPFEMELWFCRLEFGVKYLECGNVCRGWH